MVVFLCLMLILAGIALCLLINHLVSLIVVKNDYSNQSDMESLSKIGEEFSKWFLYEMISALILLYGVSWAVFSGMSGICYAVFIVMLGVAISFLSYVIDKLILVLSEIIVDIHPCKYYWDCLRDRFVYAIDSTTEPGIISKWVESWKSRHVNDKNEERNWIWVVLCVGFAIAYYVAGEYGYREAYGDAYIMIAISYFLWVDIDLSLMVRRGTELRNLPKAALYSVLSFIFCFLILVCLYAIGLSEGIYAFCLTVGIAIGLIPIYIRKIPDGTARAEEWIVECLELCSSFCEELLETMKRRAR